MLVHLISAAAWACGGFFGPADANVFSDAQVVRFEVVPEGMAVEYAVDYDGDPAEFGWIVPIPGAFVSLDEGDPTALAELVAQTDPAVHVTSEERSGCAAANDKSGALGDSGIRAGGLETLSGTAGVFAYTAIATDDAADLLAWLDENGWSARASAPDLDAYVAEGGWQFVAITLTSELPDGRATLRIVHEGDRMVFPARMSRSSMAPEQRTTILVVGDQKATMSGWAATEVEPVEIVGDTGVGVGYEDRIRALAGGTRAYGVPYYGAIDGIGYVTRFDTIADSAIHEVDPVLALDGGTPATFRSSVDVFASERARRQAEGSGCASVPSSALALPLVLVAAALTRRRR